MTSGRPASSTRWRPAPVGPGTGCCLIMVTPDAEKTMCTNLGIGALLAAEEVDASRHRRRPGHVRGGLHVRRPAHRTRPCERAVAVAREAGTEVALSLSDPYWVELHGAELASLLDRVDLLFANEQEACGIVGEADLDRALSALARRCCDGRVTRGAHGSVVGKGGRSRSRCRPPAVDQVVDTTGAGDSYAAGFLYGLIQGLDPDRAPAWAGWPPRRSSATWAPGPSDRWPPGCYERRELAAAVRLAPVVGLLAAGAAASLVGTF